MDFFNQLAMKIHLKMSFVKLIGNENILMFFFFLHWQKSLSSQTKNGIVAQQPKEMLKLTKCRNKKQNYQAHSFI